MPTNALPPHPSLDHLRHQAKALQKAVRGGDPSAAERIEAMLPGGIEEPATFPLSRAQTALAREHGFPSWPRLQSYVQVIRDLRWDPPEAAADTDDANTFCSFACLTYSELDGPQRRDRARSILVGTPEVARGNIWAAAAASDAEEVKRLLGADPTLATRRGGPNRWSPLFYLVYSRVDPDVAETAVLATARALLEAGADPHEGYLWNGGPYAFTLLTGTFGEGEMGPRRQPRHPHSISLARLLLEAGTDPVDDQSLYNRQFLPDDDHLELLLEHGLATGERPGPWRDRMAEMHLDPVGKLRVQLRWAIEHGFPHRVRVLAAHGVDIRSPYEDGRTPHEIAALYGGPDVLSALEEAGVPKAVPSHPADVLVAAAFRGDLLGVQALCAAHPEAVDALVRRGRNLLPWAAASRGRSSTVRLLVGLGLDVDSLGRSDVPVDGGWTDTGWGIVGETPSGHTALHRAAIDGDVDLIRTLLDLGADPSIRDSSFGATPLGWARHAEGEGEDRVEAIAILEPISPTDPVHPA